MANKKKKKKPTQPGVDPNELRRQKLEARREAKAQALREKEKRETRERLIRRVVLIALALGLVWFFFLRTAAPDEILGHEVEHFSNAGEGQHTSSPVSYEMSPPVSGQHNASAAVCGVHGAPIPNENMVHTLEHGAIGLVYKPDAGVEQIRQLEGVAGDYDSHVFTAPYTGDMETPIAVIAWAHTMRLEEVDEPAIREFVSEFRRGGDAPEANQECPNTQNAPFEPGDPDDAAIEDTPLPEATEGTEEESPEPEPTE